MPDQRNLILAVILSVVILLGYELFFAKKPPLPEPEPMRQSQGTAPAAPAASPGSGPIAAVKKALGSAPMPRNATPSVAGAVTAPGATNNPVGAVGSRANIIGASPRVKITTPRLTGSIDLKGARLDDLLLRDYRATIDPQRPPIVLLTPQGMIDAYYAQFGWVSTAGVEVPGAETVWTANRTTLTPNDPVTLTWTNEQGLEFSQTISIDHDFMFTVQQKISNPTTTSATVHPYGYVSRRSTPPTTGYVVLHEGLIGVIDGTLREISYSDIKDDGKAENITTGGWLGFTDKYWLAALAPDQKKQVSVRFTHHLDNTVDKYQADYLEDAMTISPGNVGISTTRLFAGAKEVALLDGYADALGIARFDLAIDFGWFYFLTKPIFYALIYIHEVVANFGFAIMLLTVAIKLCFYPLANKSYVAMSKMRKLQPEIVKLRERFGEDKVKLNTETMALYKRSSVNPAAGCLPVIIQIPVFFALYKVLFVTIEMRHAPFFGWIQDLSVPDPTSMFNLFGLLPFDPPNFMMIGVWPLLMGFTMWLQMQLNPQPTDPIQAKLFTYMPIVFTFMLAQFPAGLVIYWAWNNILSITQQWIIMKRMGVA